jgi:hypothetical protein
LIIAFVRSASLTATDNTKSKLFTVCGRIKAVAHLHRFCGFDRPRSPLGSNVAIGGLLLAKSTPNAPIAVEA